MNFDGLRCPLGIIAPLMPPELIGQICALCGRCRTERLAERLIEAINAGLTVEQFKAQEAQR
jgi:hypothetical protein